MFAFLFDRRSGLQTGLIISAIAILLFGGGVLVGLHLRWSREEVAARILNPLHLQAIAGESEGEAKADRSGAKKGAGSPGEGAGSGTDTGTGREAQAGTAPPADWVPMTEGAAPPSPAQ